MVRFSSLSRSPHPVFLLANPHSIDRGANLDAMSFFSSFQNANLLPSVAARSSFCGGLDLSSKTLNVFSISLNFLSESKSARVRINLVFVSCRFQSHSCPGHRMTQHNILAQTEDALHMGTGLRIRSSSFLSRYHKQLSCPERRSPNDQPQRTPLQSEPYA